jgi:aminoglycoside/choline kinase family phosphotransferase
MSFPVSPEDLNKEWLNQVLDESGSLSSGEKVEDFSFENISEGVGLLGIVVRVHLTYNKTVKGPTSLVIKFATDESENRELANTMNLYEREVIFFNEIANGLDIPIPKCYFAAMDFDSGSDVIVLEDLFEYSLGDQIGGITPEQAMMVVDVVAPLHAKYWGKGEEVFPDMQRIDSEDFIKRSAASFYISWEKALERFPEFFPDELRDALPVYVNAMEDIYREMGNRTKTVIHGDVRMDNALFGNGIPGLLPVILIDWQNIMISNPLYDIGWMMFTSLPVETRRECEKDVLERYVAKLKAEGVQNYSIEQCEKDYDVALLFIVHFTILIAGLFDISTEEKRRLAETGLERSIAAFFDRDCLKLIPQTLQ